MMIVRVLPSALSHLHPCLRLAGPAWPLICVEKRGTAGAAARGRRAAPRHSAAPAGLGRRRGPRRADPAPAQKAAGAPAGHAWNRAVVAPPPGHPEVDLSPPDGTPAEQLFGGRQRGLVMTPAAHSCPVDSGELVSAAAAEDRADLLLRVCQ